MDFGDLELDDDENVPFLNNASTPLSLGTVGRNSPVEKCNIIHTQPENEAVQAFDGVPKPNKRNPVRPRIPGPAGRAQFEAGLRNSGEHAGDPDFQSTEWRSAQHHTTEAVPIKSIGDSERIAVTVVVLASICCSTGGNAHILLKVLFDRFQFLC